MPKVIAMDEFHLTVSASAGLRETDYLAIRRTLNERRFQADLKSAIGNVFRKYPALSQARVRLSR